MSQKRKEIILLQIPQYVETLIARLEQAGYQAYVVGGCVRDSLLGRPPADWDIATDARPEETLRCFADHNVIETGLKHGTVTVLSHGEPCEITSYRIDGPYSDGRHPDRVDFTDDLIADLARRDFTINAMAYHPERGLQDPFGGRADLAAKRIVCVGEPAARFTEDALRIFRGLRFAAALDFTIEDRTADALVSLADRLGQVAAERIRVELDKALVGPGVRSVFSRYAAVVERVLPEIGPCVGYEQHNKYHHLDVWEHTLCAVELAPSDALLRLVMLLHDLGKPDCFSMDESGQGHFCGHPQISAELADRITARLRYPGDVSKRVEQLVRWHDAPVEASTKSVRRWLNRLGEEAFRQLLAVKRADTMAHADWCVADGLRELDELERVFERVLADRLCFTLGDLAVDGNDLRTLGVPAGKELGDILRDLLRLVIDEELPNERETLLRKASELWASNQK